MDCCHVLDRLNIKLQVRGETNLEARCDLWITKDNLTATVSEMKRLGLCFFLLFWCLELNKTTSLEPHYGTGVGKFIIQWATLRMQHNNFLRVDFASLFQFHSPAVKTVQKGEIDCRELLWGHAPLVFWFSRYFLFGEWTSAWSCHCLHWPTHSLLLQGDKLSMKERMTGSSPACAKKVIVSFGFSGHESCIKEGWSPLKITGWNRKSLLPLFLQARKSQV